MSDRAAKERSRSVQGAFDLDQQQGGIRKADEGVHELGKFENRLVFLGNRPRECRMGAAP